VGEAPGGEVAHATLINSTPLRVAAEQFEILLD
jgi:hypothetical protein